MTVTPRAVQVAPGIYAVGVQHWDRRSFDEVMSLPYGTTYNAYLVVGKEKVALVDTSTSAFGGQLLANVSQVVEPARLDYVVMNHAEPDHGGAIPQVLAAAPHAKLLASPKGVEIAQLFHQVPPDRLSTVKEEEPLDLGGVTLRFVNAPWLHWPETMFTFAVEDRVLFSCDFFGAHLASDKVFDDEVGDVLVPQARTYYAVIMMPYLKMAVAGLEKALALEPRVIAPSHGAVYRSPKRILAAYEQWTRGPLASKAVVAHVSMWGSTTRLAETVIAAMSAEGVEVAPYNLAVTDMSHLASDLVDASAIVYGSPTVLGNLHPLAGNALLMGRMLRPRLRIGAFFGSYGWGGGAATQARTGLESMRVEVVDTLDVKGPPLEKDLERAVALGRNVARKVRESLLRP